MRASRIPRPSGRAESTIDSRLLQERLKLCAVISLVIALAFYGVQLLLIRSGQERPLTWAGHALQLTIPVLEGGVWFYTRGAARSRKRLNAIDAFIMLAFGVLPILLLRELIPETAIRTGVMLQMTMLLIFMRSIFIPRTPVRTVAVSLACAFPLAVYSLYTEPVRIGVWTVMWLLATVMVTTAGSAVIYGLRQEVRHAMQLGQYTLEEKLGEGAMGVVYRARHAMLRRPTAVKLLRPEKAGERGLIRFEREVQRTAELSHPNTVSIHDFGRTQDGVFYYAMEYLDGIDLQRLVAEDGPQPPERVIHVLKQVLGALDEAHGTGLIHRDIKPGNIVLCERGGMPDVAKVVDFGLVKELETPDGLSREGALLGTPLYMSPESLRSGEAEARSDIYAVGAVAYYMLTGSHVFSGNTVVEICGQHLHATPVPPSQRVGRGLPQKLEDWVLRCLEKSPEDRPSSAAMAAQELTATFDKPWEMSRARAWWQNQGRRFKRTPGETATPETLAVDLERAH